MAFSTAFLTRSLQSEYKKYMTSLMKDEDVTERIHMVDVMEKRLRKNGVPQDFIKRIEKRIDDEIINSIVTE